jgi:hypothetical protein
MPLAFGAPSSASSRPGTTRCWRQSAARTRRRHQPPHRVCVSADHTVRHETLDRCYGRNLGPDGSASARHVQSPDVRAGTGGRRRGRLRRNQPPQGHPLVGWRVGLQHRPAASGRAYSALKAHGCSSTRTSRTSSASVTEDGASSFHGDGTGARDSSTSRARAGNARLRMTVRSLHEAPAAQFVTRRRPGPIPPAVRRSRR